MSKMTLIIGESGTGKSTSMRNLNPDDTFIINVLNKPLPFRGYKKLFPKRTKENLTGNMVSSSDPDKIIEIIGGINDKWPHIKVLIIDDFHYVTVREYMDKADTKGYDKFTIMACNNHRILEFAKDRCRDDLHIVFLSHSEMDAAGRYKPKFVGKMTDNIVKVESMFTYIFHTLIMPDGYKFLTKNDNIHMAKTPMDMFEDKFIYNDLAVILKTIDEFEEGEKEEISKDVPQ